jgi:hypothetical protein
MECLDIRDIHDIFTVYMDLSIAGIINSPKIIVTSYYHRREHTLTRKGYVIFLDEEKW